MSYVGNGSMPAIEKLREELDDYRGEVLAVSASLGAQKTLLISLTDKVAGIDRKLDELGDAFDNWKDNSKIQEIRTLKAQLKEQKVAKEKRIDWIKTIVGGVVVGVVVYWLQTFVIHR